MIGTSTRVNFIITILIFILLFLYASSCTLSFQNISTHGVADDLVDETQNTQPDIKVSLPTELGGL